MWIGHRKEVWKLMFRALARRRSEWRNCGLCGLYRRKMELRYWLVHDNVKNNRNNSWGCLCSFANFSVPSYGIFCIRLWTRILFKDNRRRRSLLSSWNCNWWRHITALESLEDNDPSVRLSSELRGDWGLYMCIQSRKFCTWEHFVRKSR